MNNKIYNAFEEIKAEEELKESTLIYLQKKAYKRRYTNTKRLVALCASLFVVILAGFFSYNAYYAQTAVIDIDVNPSVELVLNRFNLVIDQYAYNEDGEMLLKKLSLEHKSYKEALKILINEMREGGYIKDSSLFTATLQDVNANDEKKLLEDLKSYIDTILISDMESIESEIFAVDSDTKIHSHEENLSPAKYLAILELQELDPEASFESCRKHSISEIRQQTHEHENKGHEKNNGDASGEHDSENQNHENDKHEAENQNSDKSKHETDSHNSSDTHSGGHEKGNNHD